MKNIFIVFTIIILGIVGYVLFNQSATTAGTQSRESTYTGEIFKFYTESDSFTVQYSVDGELAKVMFGGNTYELKRARSASGARYVSADNSVVFWEHQGEALIEIAGENVIEGAKVIND